ncbi:MAG: hypothetical protein GEV03_08755 [Streptosporangiales bacterium]|nr:hypothetical protein [Streptosporangiales bacterium]
MSAVSPVQVRPAGRPMTVAVGGPTGLPDHLVARETLDQLTISQPCDGTILLGFAAPWRPVPVRLFRPEPTRVTLLGGTYIASLFAFRALALGALVHVATPRPRAWRPLAGRETAGRVAIQPPGSRPPVRGSMQWPVLIVNDTGPEPPDPRAGGAPWQTTLTVLPELTDAGETALSHADLVVLHRCLPDEAAVVCHVLDLDRKHTRWLPAGPEDGLALVTGHQVQYVCVGVTPEEYRMFGSPTRQDR